MTVRGIRRKLQMHVVTAELDVGKAKHLFSLRLGLSDIGPSSVGMVIMVVELEQGGVSLRSKVARLKQTINNIVTNIYCVHCVSISTTRPSPDG